MLNEDHDIWSSCPSDKQLNYIQKVRCWQSLRISGTLWKTNIGLTVLPPALEARAKVTEVLLSQELIAPTSVTLFWATMQLGFCAVILSISTTLYIPCTSDRLLKNLVSFVLLKLVAHCVRVDRVGCRFIKPENSHYLPSKFLPIWQEPVKSRIRLQSDQHLCGSILGRSWKLSKRSRPRDLPVLH